MNVMVVKLRFLVLDLTGFLVFVCIM